MGGEPNRRRNTNAQNGEILGGNQNRRQKGGRENPRGAEVYPTHPGESVKPRLFKTEGYPNF